MTRVNNDPLPIASTLDAVLSSGACQVGINRLIKIRRVFSATVAKSAYSITVNSATCYIVIRQLRAITSDNSFGYSVVDEELVYRYVNGVGTYGGTSTNYVFSGGATALGTRSDTFTPASGSVPAVLSVNYTFPGPGVAYMAGFATVQIISTTPITYNPLTNERYDNTAQRIFDGFAREAITSQPYTLYPYRRYIQVTPFTVNNVNVQITPSITYDPVNSTNSSLLLKLSTTLVETTNHGVSATIITYYTLQGGSTTIPPYSSILRNTTTVTTTPPNILNNTIGLVLTPVMVTGSVNVPPSLYINALVTGVLTRIDCFAKLETVCSAVGGQNYS